VFFAGLSDENIYDRCIFYIGAVNSMDETEKLIQQANQLMNDGEYPQAFSKFDKAIKANPNSAEAYFGKAEAGVLVSKIGVEEVIALYKKAILLDDKNPFYYSSLGAFCVETNQFNEAEAAYNKAAEVDPENAPYYYSEFAVEYYRRAPVAMEQFMDESTRVIIAKKSLKYLLKSINLTEEQAKKLL
jgi:tetratricopeptide (TPR) repeat protein